MTTLPLPQERNDRKVDRRTKSPARRHGSPAVAHGREFRRDRMTVTMQWERRLPASSFGATALPLRLAKTTHGAMLESSRGFQACRTCALGRPSPLPSRSDD